MCPLSTSWAQRDQPAMRPRPDGYLIVMGEFDAIATFQGAQWLLKSLRQAPQRRLVVIGRGSHTIQYEAERTQLYHVMADFLNERE